MAVMQLLLLSLPQPHLQVNNHSHPYQNAVLYALAPNRLQRKELQVLCECLQIRVTRVLHLGLTRKQQNTQGWEQHCKAGQLVSSCPKQIPVPHLCSVTQWSHMLCADHGPQQVTGLSKSLQFWGV